MPPSVNTSNIDGEDHSIKDYVIEKIKVEKSLTQYDIEVVKVNNWYADKYYNNSVTRLSTNDIPTWENALLNIKSIGQHSLNAYEKTIIESGDGFHLGANKIATGGYNYTGGDYESIMNSLLISRYAISRDTLYNHLIARIIFEKGKDHILSAGGFWKTSKFEWVEDLYKEAYKKLYRYWESLTIENTNINTWSLNYNRKDALERGTMQSYEDYNLFLGLLCNNTGIYSPGKRYQAKSNGGKLVKYKDIDGNDVEVAELLLNGEEMLYDLLRISPKSEKFIKPMKNAFSKYKANDYNPSTYYYEYFNGEYKNLDS